MTKLVKFLIVLLLLFAAITMYSAGSMTGVFAFIILGFLFEGAFWTGLFKLKDKKPAK